MLLNYKKYGNADEVLLILHGFLGSLDNWHTLATEWSNYYTVYTLDLRNHGKSPHAEHHSIALMADDVAEFMEQQQIASAYILGHSMGGKVAMQMAFTYANKIDKLIVADIAPRQYKRGHDTIFEALHAVDFNTISKRKDAEDLMMHLVPDFGTRQFLLKNLIATDAGKYAWRVNLPVLEADYEEIIKAVEYDGVFTKPTLFLRGALSTYISKQDEVEIIENFIQSQVVTIENAGHWLHADNPKQFSKEVLLFLQSH